MRAGEDMEEKETFILVTMSNFKSYVTSVCLTCDGWSLNLVKVLES